MDLDDYAFILGGKLHTEIIFTHSFTNSDILYVTINGVATVLVILS